VLLAAGTASYDSPDFPALDEVPDALRTVVAALQGLGFSTLVRSPGYRLDPDRSSLDAAVRRAAVAAPVVVMYYTGHGAQLEGGAYYLVSKRSDPATLSRSALAARDLLELFTPRDEHAGKLAEQPTVLVILDCCYSGSAAMSMLFDALSGLGNPDIWVIASAGPLEYAQQGVFAKAFCDALQRPTIGPSQQYVSLDSIVQAVNSLPAAYAGQEARVFPPAKGYSAIPPFFINPFHRPDVAGLTVAEQHWLSRLRGGPEESTTGFYLTGKTGRLLAGKDLAKWMSDPDARGMAVVTGSPGTGKSALLALPVLLSQRNSRAALLRKAEPGSLIRETARQLPRNMSIASVHARGLNTDQAAALIANAIGRPASTASGLLEALDEDQKRVSNVVVVDAIDEAASPPTLLSSLLVPLARHSDLKVVVGARPHSLAGVADAGLTIDLDMPHYQDPQALTDYVRRLLLAAEEPSVGTCYQSDASGAAAVAEEIARRATSATTTKDERSESFLIGRLLALSVRGRSAPVDTTSPDWKSDLPASIADAFDQDLARLGTMESKARALLASLAWARGPGLPWENIWVPTANALSPSSDKEDQSITDKDVRQFLEKAGAYVVEDRGPGQRSVYRPFHEMLAAHLRDSIQPPGVGMAPTVSSARRGRSQTERIIADTLIATVPTYGRARDWRAAHPYLYTYLAQHAAAAGPTELSALVHDPGFLPAADPVTLTPLLRITLPGLRDVARVYRRARPLLGNDARINAAYLNEASCALTGTAMSMGRGIDRLYDTQLASVHRDDSLLTLPGHAGPVFSVAFGLDTDGRLLLASGSRDSTVRVWDPITGALVGEPFTGDIGQVLSVTFCNLPDGRLLLASGNWDNTVRLWDPVTGAPVGEPFVGHTDAVSSVAFGTGPDARVLLASGSRDSTVRVWDLDTGSLVGAPLTGHGGQVASVAFGNELGGRLLLASGSWDSTVRLWDPVAGTPVGEPLTGHAGSVFSVALGTGPDGRLLLASGGEDRTVRLWDPVGGAPMGEPLAGHADAVLSVTVGWGSDGLALASGSADGRVQVWDPTAGTPLREPLSGHTEPVLSVAFGSGPDGRLVLASGSDDRTARLWDPLAGATADEPIFHTEPVLSVAFGTRPDGRLVLASGSDDRTARLWDPLSGTPIGEPLTGHTGAVRTVAFGIGRDRLLLASGSRDMTIRLWDPVTGAPLREPLSGHTGPVLSVALSVGPDDRLLLATGSNDQEVRLWDPASDSQVRDALTGHSGPVLSVAFGIARDRLLLASGSRDKTIRLWDPVTGAQIGEPLTGHTEAVASVAFGTGSDGSPLLASASWDKTVRLWDPATCTSLGDPATGHAEAVASVAFGTSQDGRPFLVSGGRDNTVRIWDLATLSCIAVIHRRSSVHSVAVAAGQLAIGDHEGVSVIKLTS
jgi:WD40 repeat protein